MSDEITKGIEDLTTKVENVAASIEKVAALPEDVKAAQEELEKLTISNKTTADQLAVHVQDLAEYKAALKDSLGKSGADDWREEVGKFIKAVYHVQKDVSMPDYLQKTAADYVTTTDAQGGYLVPRLVADEIIKLTLTHGKLWPHFNKITMPAGVTMRYPWESTLADVSFRRGAAGTTQLTQGGAAHEVSGPIAWGADTLNPDLLSGYAKVANEAMTAPGVSIPDAILMQITAQLIRKIEYVVLRGDDTGTATAHTGRNSPHDGIMRATNINTQTAMATVTYALLNTFIGECLADNEGAGNEEENFLITTPAVANTLRGVLTQQGTNWGDVAQGANQPTFAGYRFATSPFANRVQSTNEHDYMIMSPLEKITIGWTGNFNVSFNESLGWAANETWMMVSTHADFAIGNPGMHHCAAFTALA